LKKLSLNSLSEVPAILPQKGPALHPPLVWIFEGISSWISMMNTTWGENDPKIITLLIEHHSSFGSSLFSRPSVSQLSTKEKPTRHQTQLNKDTNISVSQKK
jgi:hypothetical protein